MSPRTYAVAFEALVAMRQGGGTPRGMRILGATGAEPTVSILEVAATIWHGEA
jgi:hypothetical protein